MKLTWYNLIAVSNAKALNVIFGNAWDTNYIPTSQGTLVLKLVWAGPFWEPGISSAKGRETD